MMELLLYKNTKLKIKVRYPIVATIVGIGKHVAHASLKYTSITIKSNKLLFFIYLNSSLVYYTINRCNIPSTNTQPNKILIYIHTHNNQTMKLIFSLSLSFLLFSFITNLSLAFSNDDGEEVLDINGNPIIPGGEYYIFPSNQDHRSGGLKLEITGHLKCPITVIQNNVITELPVKFSVPGISLGKIFTGTPMEIEFTKKPNCAKSSKWLIFVDETLLGSVGIGIPENCSDIRNGNFNIQKYGSGNVYNLRFCAKVKESPTPICLNIGRYNNGGKEGGNRLVFCDGKGYPFVFVDAASYESGIILEVA